MSENWRHIMLDGNCPDESVIREYLDGKLSAAKKFEIENHLAACEGCRDFTEGLTMLTDDQMTRHETEIKGYIHEKLASTQSKKVIHPYKRLAVAASILLVLSVGTLFWFTAIRPSQSKLAYKEALQQPAKEPKIDLPVNVEKPFIDLTKDSAEEITAPEVTFVRPAPAPDEIIVLELVDQEETLRATMAGIEVSPSPAAQGEMALETIQSASRPTLERTQSLPAIPFKTLQKVQGQVVEASTGAPLPGTTVTVKGSTSFALTDADGHFEIPVKDQAEILEFSFLGYDNETIPIADTTQLKIEMTQNLMAMDEVVVVGYGVKRRRMLTGATPRLEEKNTSQKIISEQDIALPDVSGNEVYDTINLLSYYLQLGDKEKALSFFDRLRELMKEGPLPEAILKAEQLTREDRLKRASRIIQNWLEANNP